MLKHTFRGRGQREEEFFIHGHAHDKDLARRSPLQKCSTNGTDVTRFVFEDYLSENYKKVAYTNEVNRKLEGCQSPQPPPILYITIAAIN